jgi:transposase
VFTGSVDSTHIKAPARRQAQKGGLSSCHWHLARRATDENHALSDDCGRPVAFALTPGNAHDLVGAKALLAIRCPSRKLLADRAYDAASLRDWLAERGTEPVTPPNPTRKHPHAYDRHAYRGRNLIERMFCRIKDFRRIATRSDKRADICPLSTSQPQSHGGQQMESRA